MARIAGVDIPREKRLGTSLTYIFGIGDTTAVQVCEGTGIDPATRVRDLTDEEVTRLRNWIDANLKVEGDLRRDVSQDIKRKMEIGLTYIFGIGPTRAKEILKGAMVSGDTRVRDLSEDEIVRLRGFIDANFKVEGDLRREESQNIKRKVEIVCYQGLRHRRSLPVHGQRTHTNARTRKGPKKTVGVKRKKGK